MQRQSKRWENLEIWGLAWHVPQNPEDSHIIQGLESSPTSIQTILQTLFIDHSCIPNIECISKPWQSSVSWQHVLCMSFIGGFKTSPFPQFLTQYHIYADHLLVWNLMSSRMSTRAVVRKERGSVLTGRILAIAQPTVSVLSLAFLVILTDLLLPSMLVVWNCILS